MNKVGALMKELRSAELRLARHYRVVADRQATEQDVYYLCRTLALQCETHADDLREMASGFGQKMSARQPGRLSNTLSGVRRRLSASIGQRSVSGLLLLRDL